MTSSWRISDIGTSAGWDGSLPHCSGIARGHRDYPPAQGRHAQGDSSLAPARTPARAAGALVCVSGRWLDRTGAVPWGHRRSDQGSASAGEGSRRRAWVRSVLLVDASFLHHEAHILEKPHVLQRVAAHGDDVRKLALTDRAELRRHPEQIRIRAGRCPYRLHGRHTVLDHQAELARIGAEAADADVRAKTDLHARVDRLAKIGELRSHDLLRLADELRRVVLADALADLERRHQIGTVLLHQRTALIVHQCAMLDRGGSGADGSLDAFRTMRVHRKLEPEAVRLVRPGGELLGRRLAAGGVAVVRQHRAG